MTSIWTKFKINTMIAVLMNKNQSKAARQTAHYHLLDIGKEALPQLEKLNDKLRKEYIELKENMSNKLINNITPSIKPYSDMEYKHWQDIGQKQSFVVELIEEINKQ
ncbi:MAG: hypothetical protein KZQ91_04980 [Candidatus Thiodiazotropha sp. (ex Lucinoma borealis)]|nr:hypothetical protein [Candidatus Thiodiazotropha sp. (ex Lucinoma borealis)]